MDYSDAISSHRSFSMDKMKDFGSEMLHRIWRFAALRFSPWIVVFNEGTDRSDVFWTNDFGKIPINMFVRHFNASEEQTSVEFI
jgi:hypothetical protein